MMSNVGIHHVGVEEVDDDIHDGGREKSRGVKGRWRWLRKEGGSVLDGGAVEAQCSEVSIVRHDVEDA